MQCGFSTWEMPFQKHFLPFNGSVATGRMAPPVAPPLAPPVEPPLQWHLQWPLQRYQYYWLPVPVFNHKSHPAQQVVMGNKDTFGRAESAVCRHLLLLVAPVGKKIRSSCRMKEFHDFFFLTECWHPYDCQQFCLFANRYIINMFPILVCCFQKRFH